MSLKMIHLRLVVALAAVTSSALYAQDVSLKQLHINSRWGGLGTPAGSDLTIIKNKSKYRLGSKTVAPELIDAFLKAIGESDLPQPELGNLGVTREWLANKKERLGAQYQGGPQMRAPNQQALYKKKFEDPAFIAPLVNHIYTSLFHTDDYPSVEVQLTFENGSVKTLSSNSQQPFMLPWKIEEAGITHKTFNANISRALFCLLPKKAINRDRISGEGLSRIIRESVDRALEPELGLLDSDNRAGGALTQLRQHYSVESSEINEFHSEEYGTEWSGKQPHETNLHVTLRKPSLPPGVTLSLVLRYVDGKAEGVDQFLNTAARYEDLVFSVPWLNAFIKDHPKVQIRISYVHDKSFGEKAMRTFTQDMHARGRDDLVEEARAKQSEIALLLVGMTYYESYWLVFPDKHMMMWRYQSPAGLLKWTPSDFPAGECAKYKTNFGGCSGREVTPEGILAARHTPRDVECMIGFRAAHPVEAASEALFPVMDHDRTGFIDHTGKLVIPLCFDKAGDFSEGLARFERDGNWGYIDAAGSVVIEPTFPWAEEFSEGLAHVQISGEALGYDAKWGFIDKTGKIVIGPEFKGTFGGKYNIGSDDSGGSFHNGLAVVEVNGKKGFIDKTGNLTIPAEFTYAYPFSEGLAAVTKSKSGDEGWGYIDTAGRYVIPPQFEWGSSFQDGLAPVNRVHNCGYIDKTGAYVLHPPVSTAETDCGTVWGDFVDGLARWKVGNKYGFIDRSGKMVIEPKFDLAFHFSEGLAAVKIDGKWGYIDKTGKIVIEPMTLRNADDFHHGLAFVTTTDVRYGYIDRAGKYIWTPTLLYNDTR